MPHPLPHPHRNESHDPMERSKRTLSMIHTLYLLFQDGKLQERTFMAIFKAVMPQWLEFLNSLRSEPGKMQILQDQIKYVALCGVEDTLCGVEDILCG